MDERNQHPEPTEQPTEQPKEATEGEAKSEHINIKVVNAVSLHLVLTLHKGRKRSIFQNQKNNTIKKTNRSLL